MKRILILIVLSCLVLFCLSACNGKGGKTRPTNYDGVQSVDALLDYAKRLEANGDYEAAADLYELIAKAAAGPVELPGNAEAIEQYKEAQEVFSSLGH